MMFKLSFLSLVDISCLEINLDLIIQGKEYPKLNQLTVNIYHRLFKSKKKPKIKK